jgi:hypothetical protein
MTDIPSRRIAREIVVMAGTFAAAVVVIPPVVAAVGYQSGQAMLWPALTSLYTYFLRYTLLAALAATVLVEATRLVVKRLRRPTTPPKRTTRL